jgi:hypothetical protein
MREQQETYIRWEPVPGLPEHPIGAVRFSYDGETLATTCAYSAGCDKLLTLRFSPRAFKAYDEHSDPWMEQKPPQPIVDNPRSNAWTWPLQEVRNSRWLARVVARDGGIDDFAWRHFVIVSADLCLHIMAVDVDGVELI